MSWVLSQRKPCFQLSISRETTISAKGFKRQMTRENLSWWNEQEDQKGNSEKTHGLR